VLRQLRELARSLCQTDERSYSAICRLRGGLSPPEDRIRQFAAPHNNASLSRPRNAPDHLDQGPGTETKALLGRFEDGRDKLEANNQGQNCVLYAEALADLPGAHRHRLVFQTKIEKYLDSNCPLHDIG